MDTKQVVTIAVTALVSTVTTLVVTSFASFAKNTALSDANKQRVRRMFSKKNILILLACGWSVWLIAMTRNMLRESGPITRFTIALIASTVMSDFLWLLMLGIMASNRYFEHKRRQQAAEHSASASD